MTLGVPVQFHQIGTLSEPFDRLFFYVSEYSLLNPLVSNKTVSRFALQTFVPLPQPAFHVSPKKGL